MTACRSGKRKGSSFFLPFPSCLRQNFASGPYNKMGKNGVERVESCERKFAFFLFPPSRCKKKKTLPFPLLFLSPSLRPVSIIQFYWRQKTLVPPSPLPFSSSQKTLLLSFFPLSNLICQDTASSNWTIFASRKLLARALLSFFFLPFPRLSALSSGRRSLENLAP